MARRTNAEVLAEMKEIAALLNKAKWQIDHLPPKVNEYINLYVLCFGFSTTEELDTLEDAFNDWIEEHNNE